MLHAFYFTFSFYIGGTNSRTKKKHAQKKKKPRSFFSKGGQIENRKKRKRQGQKKRKRQGQKKRKRKGQKKKKRKSQQTTDPQKETDCKQRANPDRDQNEGEVFRHLPFEKIQVVGREKHKRKKTSRVSEFRCWLPLV